MRCTRQHPAKGEFSLPAAPHRSTHELLHAERNRFERVKKVPKSFAVARATAVADGDGEGDGAGAGTRGGRLRYREKPF